MWEAIIINAYSYYKQARDASWKCLLDTGINFLPVQTLKIAEHFGIDVVKNSTVNMLMPSEYGCSIVDKNGKWTIIYEDTDPKGRIRFTVAHELGHILLGHELSDGFGHYRRITVGKPTNEKQADEFAARLLAPACVLWALNATSAQAIADLCDISMSAAQYRSKRMEKLVERNMFLTHPMEKKVFQAFAPWIEQQQKHRP